MSPMQRSRARVRVLPLEADESRFSRLFSSYVLEWRWEALNLARSQVHAQIDKWNHMVGESGADKAVMVHRALHEAA